MDTNERKRRRPASKGAGRARRAAAGRPAGTAVRTERRPRKRTVRSTEDSRKRMIRAPKEHVPQVVYTAPKPIHKGRFVLKLLTVAAVVMAVVMGLSVFFRVETVMVAGAQQYTPWMVREASGIAEGDSLLGISEPRIASRITEKLPYVEDVKVGIQLPGTVKIEIIELQVTYAIQDAAGSWWLISSGGRVVEKTTAPGSYTRIQGLKLSSPQADAPVQAAPETDASDVPQPTEGTDPTNPLPITGQQTADAKLQALLSVLEELEANRIIGTVSVIDITDAQDMRLQMGDRLVVRLGNDQRLAYKIAYMAGALEQLDEHISGDLDLTLEYMEEALFTPAG